MKVPKSPSWCSCCITYGTCDDHRGPNGEPVEYTGRDAYEPSEWIIDVVGTEYNGPDGRVYQCFGYDPRHGFWMQSVHGEPVRKTNISEAAIGRTFHKRWPR